MNLQRPLAAEGSFSGSLSVSSQGDGIVGPSVLPTAPMPQKKKKPGPKRDSQPAPNEKLERNRQAQRTHRERKEQYAKDLELEVMRLKELFTEAARERDGAIQTRDEALRERDKLAEENQRLREMVQLSTLSGGTDSGSTAPPPRGHDNLLSVWELSESRGFASDGIISQEPMIKPEPNIIRIEPGQDSSPVILQPPPGMDYDEMGLDFVLTLERPCMGHIQYLHVRAHNYQSSGDAEMAGQPMEVPDDGENQHISGHALMATSTPYSHILENPNSRYPTQLPQVQRKDLLRLLNLSSQLQVTEPELPPVKAWIKLMQDERVKLLSVHDLELLKTSLVKKVHCYRFGAVVDEKELQDALQRIIDTKQAAALAASSTPPGLMKIESQ